MSKKMKIVVLVLVCIFVLAITAAISYHAIVYPFKALSVDVEVHPMTKSELKYCAHELNKYRNDDGYFEYLNENFEFDSGDPDEYCCIKVIVEFKNTNSIRKMKPKYLIPCSDNDVIGYSVQQLKYDSFEPGETGDVTCRFYCRRNGMTDEELRNYIFNLNYYFVQSDVHFNERQSKLSLKKFA
ncbi:MAG: hypothetical protein NC122_01120 [Faecalibacterium sp.]|nr:hypothetical protein [Ruminococcus sp.]MCM1391237.1 hypothetical protein [Ruminococcus sp.]MCM1484789.1 hypothetical protein [Faecalibacterium sp.]